MTKTGVTASGILGQAGPDHDGSWQVWAHSSDSFPVVVQQSRFEKGSARRASSSPTGLVDLLATRWRFVVDRATSTMRPVSVSHCCQSACIGGWRLEGEALAFEQLRALYGHQIPVRGSYDLNPDRQPGVSGAGGNHRRRQT